MARGIAVAAFVAGVVVGAAGAIGLGRAGTGPGTATAPASAPATAPAAPTAPAPTTTPPAAPVTLVRRGGKAPPSTDGPTGPTTATAPATATTPATASTPVTATAPATATSPVTATTPTAPSATAPVPATQNAERGTPNAPAPPVSTALREFRGRVLDGTQKPVAGAWVSALRDYRPAVEVPTDAEGRFVVGVPGTDAVHFQARARHASTVVTPEVEAEAQGETVLVLDHPDEGTLVGRVVSRAGEAVGGAEIEVFWTGPDVAEGAPPIAATRTDLRGVFAVPGLTAPAAGGAFYVAARHDRFFGQGARLAVKDPVRLPDPFEVTVTLLDAGLVRGTLVDAAGAPVAEGGLMVVVRTERGPGEWRREPVAQGAFVVRVAKAGALVLTPVVGDQVGVPVVLPDFEPGTIREGFRIVFRPAPPLATGRLVVPAGVGLTDVQLELNVVSGGLAAGGKATPHTLDPATGALVLPREFLGCEGDSAYATLKIVAPGCKPRTVDFNVRDGETADLGEVALEGA